MIYLTLLYFTFIVVSCLYSEIMIIPLLFELLGQVGLVNCIPQERFKRGFAKRDDTGLSRLALRSSVPA